MHAFLVHNFDKLPACRQAGPDTLNVIPDPSIGIDDIRQIQFFLSRKPIQSDHNTVVIHQAHLLTLPAQHALLKTLEEPPPGTLIYLVTTQPHSLLPTILSRVQIADLPDHPDLPDLSKSKTLLEKLQKSGVGDRLKILEEQEFTRESALKFLDDLENLMHRQVSSGPLSTINYELITSTRRYLKANCNLKLCLAHLALM